MSDLKTRVTVPPGKSNSTRLTGLSLPIDFLMPNSSKTCAVAARITCHPLTLLPEDSPASRRNTSSVWRGPVATARGCMGCQYSVGKQLGVTDRYGLHNFRR